MIVAPLLLLLPSLGFALAPACTKAVALDAWTASLDEAERAFAALDEATFDASMEEAAQGLSCLDGPVLPPLAARYHRLVGLRLYVRHDEAGALLALASARAVDPFGAFPSALLPPGHEARAMAGQASTPGARQRAPRIRDGALLFDGTISRARPADRPTLMQIQVEDAIWSSRYLAPSDPLTVPAELRVGPSKAAWVGLGSGVAFGATGAALYGVASVRAAQLNAAPPDDLSLAGAESLRSSTNGLVLASGVSAALSGACLAVALVRW